MKYITFITGLVLFVINLTADRFIEGYPAVVKWPLVVVSLGAIIAALAWAVWDHLHESPPAPTRSPPPPGASRPDDLGRRAESLESSCKSLEKVAEGLRSRISDVHALVDAAVLGSENENLQDLLKKEKEEKKAAGEDAQAARREASAARTDAELTKKELKVARDDLEKAAEAIRQLQAELRQSKGKLDAFLKAEADRLGEIVPAGLLESPAGEQVRWCFDHAAKGDRLAAQILAALQSIKAAQDDAQLKGLLLSSLQVLGQSLSRLLDRDQLTPSQKCDQFNEWANVLNALSASRFTITVPSIGARINLNTMVSSGSDDGSVTNVNCWGIRNEKGDLAYLAEIS